MTNSTARQTLTLAEADGVMSVFVLTTADPAVIIWPCERCWEENGEIRMYRHVNGGTCFRCGGAGGDPMTLAAAQVRADKLIKGRLARMRAAERERLAKLAKRAAAQAALVEQYPTLALLHDAEASGGVVPRDANTGAILTEFTYNDYGPTGDWYHDRITPLGDFVAKMAEQFRTEGRLSDRQAQATVEAIATAQARNAEREAERAAASPAPTGRITVTGEVLSVKTYDGDYGITIKMMVKLADGARVFGTMPASLYGHDVDKGTRVEFTATFAPAADDPSFAKFSRPTKASLLA